MAVVLILFGIIAALLVGAGLFSLFIWVPYHLFKRWRQNKALALEVSRVEAQRKVNLV